VLATKNDGSILSCMRGSLEDKGGSSAEYDSLKRPNERNNI
jgi:hypothetical protein